MSPNVLERMRAVDAALKAKDADPRVVEVSRHFDRCVTLLADEMRPELERRLLVGL